MRNKQFTSGILVNTVFFVLIMIISGTSCSHSGYKKLEDSDEFSISSIYIFGEGFSLAKYRTNFSFYGRNISGITLIKKLDNSYRVVSMSELGMKYFDFEFPFDENKSEIIHYIMEPMNKKLLVKMLVRDIGMLFYLPEVNSSKVRISDDSIYSLKKNTLNYLFCSKGQVFEITRNSRPVSSGKVMVVSGKAGNDTPVSIAIDNGKTGCEFDLIEDKRSNNNLKSL